MLSQPAESQFNSKKMRSYCTSPTFWRQDQDHEQIVVLVHQIAVLLIHHCQPCSLMCSQEDKLDYMLYHLHNNYNPTISFIF